MNKIEEKIFAKVEIVGKIELITGLHIGGSNSFSAIGAVDSPIVKDVITGYPMIPGSSFKGKLRALLAKQYNTAKDITGKPNNDCDILTDIFGNSDEGKRKKSRVIFSDMIMSNWKELKKSYGLTSNTEVKFENSINRITCVANPRQIERAIRGSEFDLSIIYEVNDMEILKKDIEIISTGLELMTYDYLGGNGTRGYGKIKFNNLELKALIGKIDSEIIDFCNERLSRV